MVVLYANESILSFAYCWCLQNLYDNTSERSKFKAISLSRFLSHLGPAQIDKQMTRANSLDGGDLYYIQLLNEFVLRMTE